MLESYSPVERFLKTIRYWWLVTGIMVVGGGCGLLVYSIQPDIFQSSAVISVGIDYSRAGLLTDIEEDQIVEIIGDVISSQDVLDRVSVKASEQEPAVFLRLRNNAFIERKNFRWILYTRAEEAEAAVRMVNIWTEEAVSALEEAYSHSLTADSYSQYLDSLVNCLEQSVALDSGQVFCKYTNLEFIQDEIKKVNRELVVEKLASNGVFPGVLFTVTERGEYALPIRENRSLHVFGGSLLGLLVSFFVVSGVSKRDR